MCRELVGEARVLDGWSPMCTGGTPGKREAEVKPGAEAEGSCRLFLLVRSRGKRPKEILQAKSWPTPHTLASTYSRKNSTDIRDFNSGKERCI